MMVVWHGYVAKYEIYTMPVNVIYTIVQNDCNKKEDLQLLPYVADSLADDGLPSLTSSDVRRFTTYNYTYMYNYTTKL